MSKLLAFSNVNKYLCDIIRTMKKEKRHIFYLLFFISIIMLVVPVIPHHHHANGAICMKQDAVPETQCPVHHQHHQDSDPCCDSECMAKLQSPVPTAQMDIIHPVQFAIILFHEPLFRLLILPQQQALRTESVYIESLHGTFITRATGLRAPPYILA